jgi:hypothetical protein
MLTPAADVIKVFFFVADEEANLDKAIVLFFTKLLRP